MKAVLDINILVSSAINRTGMPARLVDLAVESRYVLVVSGHIVSKLDEVFRRPHIAQRVSDSQRERLLVALADEERRVTPDPTVRGIAPDLADDLVLGTAVAAGADFLVTGDKGLLDLVEYRDVRIVTAHQFLEAMEQSS